jgi:hypothetical protein
VTTSNDIPDVLQDPIIVKAVPISADQVRVLESLERAFLSLYTDFQHDVGLRADEMAGGLYRFTTTLNALTSFWKDQAEDLATIEGWRAALARISNECLSASDAQRVAAEALSTSPGDTRGVAQGG